MKHILFTLIASSLLLSACGAQAEATPEALAEDIQATAVSMAWTMAAQTIEAMPTATQAPPTETPTITPLPPTATPAITSTPVPTATQDKDICDQPLTNWEGAEAPIVVDKRVKGDITLSIYVSWTARGYCGYIYNNSSSFTVPQGCFTAFAWITEKNKSYSLSGGPFCPNNSDKWTLVISDNGMSLK